MTVCLHYFTDKDTGIRSSFCKVWPDFLWQINLVVSCDSARTNWNDTGCEMFHDHLVRFYSHQKLEMFVESATKYDKIQTDYVGNKWKPMWLGTFEMILTTKPLVILSQTASTIKIDMNMDTWRYYEITLYTLQQPYDTIFPSHTVMKVVHLFCSLLKASWVGTIQTQSEPNISR